MKRFLLLFVGLQAGTVLLKAGNNEPQLADYSGKANQKTICFEENKGQVHDQNDQPRPDVLFGGQDGNMTFHLKRNGISYQLSRVDTWKEDEDLRAGGMSLPKKKSPDEVTIYRLDLSWLNANTNAPITPGDPVPSCNNYYTTTCPDGALQVRSYKTVTYSSLYNGVDLKWYEKNGHLKYDYIVAPHADYKQIQLQIEGAVSISINAQGELVIETPLGQIIEEAPFVTQGTRTLISKWIVRNNTVSFSIEGINPNEELIIDPAVRAWGTYYGGLGYEDGSSCISDANGNVYLVGKTSSPSGPEIATSGSHQVVYVDNEDAYLVKFNSVGVRQWGTYYGGSGTDWAFSCATDGNGNVYLVGACDAWTGNALATAGSHQSVIGGSWDAFLAKFDGTGVRQWGTYYGGGGFTHAYSCAVDVNGDVYIAGETDVNAGTSIATSGSHQSVYGGGVNDGFLAKFNSSGVRQWGTYYGGTGIEVAFSCATDASGSVYIAGSTDTPLGNAIATPGSHQSIFAGFNDAFLVKFNSAGVRQWGTYYGDIYEEGYSCAVDPSGNVFLAGYSGDISTVIATSGSHQVAYGGSGDAFLVKFNSSGVRQWGTYYGGYLAEYGVSCATDGSGNVFMAGYTSSDTGTAIATSGSQQVVYGGGVVDAFLVKFNGAGLRQWGTYYGGADYDWGSSCACDGNGNVYLGGTTHPNSLSGIASAGAHQNTRDGSVDAFLAKFDGCLTSVNVNLSSQTNLSCFGDSNGSATVTASGGPGLTYSWSPNGGTAPTASGLAAGNYTCTVTNSCGNLNTQTVSITEPPQLIPASSSTNILCNGDSATVTVSATGGTPAYTGTGSFSVVAGTYSYTVTDANGCTSTTTIVVTQSASITTSQTISICNSDSLVVGPSVYYSSGTYADVFTASNGCDSTVTTNLTVNPAITTSQTISVCNGDSAIVGSSVYYSSGTYTDVLTSVNGCDSTITTNLTVNPAIDVTTTLNSITITANQSGATYQWIDCNNGNQPIAGQTGQSFTATVNGSYAVIVTQNACSDTSACVVILSVGTISLPPIRTANVYPNPSATGDFIFILDRASSISITDARGRVVFAETYDAGQNNLHLEELNDGIYFLLIHDATGITTQKLIISR